MVSIFFGGDLIGGFVMGRGDKAVPDDTTSMHDHGEHDPGLSVEPLSEVAKPPTSPDAVESVAASTAARPPHAAEQPYRPVNRPPVALLTILDHGSTTAGETLRIREPVCLIGRTEGSVVIPHDQSMSSRHAEIIREAARPP